MSGHAWATEDTRSNKSGKNSWPHHAYILAQRRAMKKKKKGRGGTTTAQSHAMPSHFPRTQLLSINSGYSSHLLGLFLRLVDTPQSMREEKTFNAKPK